MVHRSDRREVEYTRETNFQLDNAKDKMLTKGVDYAG